VRYLVMEVVEGDPLANLQDLRRIKLVVRGGEALSLSRRSLNS